MKKIVLTGANGFVGSYFKNKYAHKYNIETFSFLRDNFESLNLNGVDVVLHLSALVHQMSGADEEEYSRVNVEQTLNLAKKAKESGVGQFIFMSSVKVYGEESSEPYSEDTPCKPEDGYGKSKLKAEEELQKLESETFKVAIVRTPIVYGEGVKANIKNLVNLIRKVPILPFGSIENRRSMIYIGNLNFFIDRIIEKKESGVFLVSDERALSTSELIELISKALDKRVYLVKVPFFESLLRLAKPSFHKRLFESLEVSNKKTISKLLENGEKGLPYSVEDGIKFMIKGEE